MKNILLLVVVASLLSGCTSDEPGNPDEPTTPSNPTTEQPTRMASASSSCDMFWGVIDLNAEDYNAEMPPQYHVQGALPIHSFWLRVTSCTYDNGTATVNMATLSAQVRNDSLPDAYFHDYALLHVIDGSEVPWAAAVLNATGFSVTGSITIDTNSACDTDISVDWGSGSITISSVLDTNQGPGPGNQDGRIVFQDGYNGTRVIEPFAFTVKGSDHQATFTSSGNAPLSGNTYSTPIRCYTGLETTERISQF